MKTLYVLPTQYRSGADLVSAQAATPWDEHRGESAEASLGRPNGELSAASLSMSQLDPRSGTAVYQQRLPEGLPWYGLWTFCYVLQGEDLEIYREVMFQERRNLYRQE